MFGLSVWQLIVVFVAVVLPLLGLVLFGLLVVLMARRPAPPADADAATDVPRGGAADARDRFEA